MMTTLKMTEQNPGTSRQIATIHVQGMDHICWLVYSGRTPAGKARVEMELCVDQVAASSTYLYTDAPEVEHSTILDAAAAHAASLYGDDATGLELTIEPR